MQEEVVLLSTTISNRLDDLVDSSNKEDVFSRHRNRNATSPQLPATGRDRVTNHSEPEERIKGAKKDTSDVSFFYLEIIKYT